MLVYQRVSFIDRCVRNNQNCLVVGTPTPVKNISHSQLGLLFPTEWKVRIHSSSKPPTRKKCRFFMVFLCFFFTSKIGFTSGSADPTLWSRHGHSKPFCWSRSHCSSIFVSVVRDEIRPKSSSNPQLTED